MIPVAASTRRRSTALSRTILAWWSTFAAVGTTSISAAMYSIAPAQLVAQRHGIDHVAAFGQRHHRPEQETVAFAIEHAVVQDLGGLERRVLVEHHRA